MSFENNQVIGICGAAWGDEGKGKFTDELAGSADMVVRAQGGCNAGHTVVFEGKKLKLHHVPSGIAHPKTVNIIANGVVIDPRILIEQEFAHLNDVGVDKSSLLISGDAHLIMPWHRIIDKAREWALAKNKIGTTARGIGPTYSDKINRIGLRINDLHDVDFFKEKMATIIAEKEKMITEVFNVPRNVFEEWMQADDQMNGAWIKDGKFDLESIAASYMAWAKILLPMVTDTRKLIHAAYTQGKKILLEGAQGLLLDIDHGTYPFVTSSNCAAGGFSTGSGIPPQIIDQVLSILSAYTTRVGGGPFPTELGTEEEISIENGNNRLSFEAAKALALTAKDDYTTGKIIRHIAGEFGTTTGRPRRTGWFDAVAAKFNVQTNGPDVILSKFDVLDVMPTLKLCIAYKYSGPETFYNGKKISNGSLITEFPTDARILQFCKPGAFAEYPGWLCDTTQMTDYSQLPEKAIKYLEGIIEHTGCKIRKLSIGPDRKQTIVMS